MKDLTYIEDVFTTSTPTPVTIAQVTGFKAKNAVLDTYQAVKETVITSTVASAAAAIVASETTSKAAIFVAKKADEYGRGLAEWILARS
jgi:hypothetical protein